MSKEYIEKEAATNYLTLNMCWYDEEGGEVDDWDERKAIISDLLDGIPPADVKPVVRGEWVEDMRYAGSKKSCGCTDRDCACSVCGAEFMFNFYRPEYKFCPNCGAEMGREINDERTTG